MVDAAVRASSRSSAAVVGGGVGGPTIFSAMQRWDVYVMLNKYLSLTDQKLNTYSVHIPTHSFPLHRNGFRGRYRVNSVYRS